MGRRLAREAHRIGVGSLKGRLYRVSWYPGLIEESREDERVWGEVFELRAPLRTLCWLDAYEGVTPESPERGDYLRRERRVQLACGAELRAWVYIYRRDVSNLPLVPGGRWVPQTQ